MPLMYFSASINGILKALMSNDLFNFNFRLYLFTFYTVSQRFVRICVFVKPSHENKMNLTAFLFETLWEFLRHDLNDKWNK